MERGMNDQRFYSLLKLKEAAQAACDESNWGDLSCVSARAWMDEAGARGYTVLISEASPSNHPLQVRIAAALAKRGFEGIDVETFW